MPRKKAAQSSSSPSSSSSEAPKQVSVTLGWCLENLFPPEHAVCPVITPGGIHCTCACHKDVVVSNTSEKDFDTKEEEASS